MQVSGDDERISTVVQSRGGSWGREDRGDPFGVANFLPFLRAKGITRILVVPTSPPQPHHSRVRLQAGGKACSTREESPFWFRD